MGEQINSGKLGKFLSVEILSLAAASVFAGGVAWASLNSKIESNSQKSEISAQKQEEIIDEMQQMKTALEVSNVRQSSIFETLKEQKKDIERIRELLETRK